MSRPRGRGGAVALVCAVALAWASPAVADIKMGDGEIGFDYGLTRFSEDLGDDTGGRFGLHVGQYLPVHENFQYEIQLASAAARRQPLPGIREETRFDQAMLNGLFNFHPKERIEPYLGLGVGLTRLQLKAVGIGTDDLSAAVQLAGGSRFFFGGGDRVAFRIDLSLLLAKFFDKNFTFPTLGGGFTWRLGRRR